MKIKLIFFAVIALGITILQFCNDSPTELSSPEYASSNIRLLSSTSNRADTVITDSVGREIELVVTYTLGYFIDSVHIEIFSDASFLAGGAPDSLLIVRFNEDDLRDTTRFLVKFSTVGKRHFVVRTFKHHGFISLSAATARIIPLASMIGNHEPQFIINAPKRGYNFKSGDLVRFPVKASDIDGNVDSLTFIYSTKLPRPTTSSLQNGFFEWQSESGDKGVYPILFTVADKSMSTSITVKLAIDTTFNIPPLITSSPPPSARTSVMYEYRPTASDEESPFLTWTLTGAIPNGMHFDSLTGTILWTPTEGTTVGGPMWLKVFDTGIPPQSDSQMVVISIAGRPPLASHREVSTGLGTPVTIQLFAKYLDRDGADTVFTFKITKFPLHGSATLSGSPSVSGNSSVTYTPDTAYRGVDTIRFIACDAVHCSDTETVIIYVAFANQKPVAKGQQVSTKEDTPLSLQLLAEDVETPLLTYSILKDPRHGVLNGSSKDRIYTPHSNFFGSDTFTFVAHDDQLESDPAMVIIKIASVNDTPVVEKIGIPTALNTPVMITLSASDPDDSIFSFEISSGPALGKIDISGLPALLYMPPNGYKGADSLTYRGTDAQGCASIPARVLILIGSNNSRPTAKRGTVTVAEDASIVIELQGTDAELSPLTFAAGKPRHGALTGTDSFRKYLPDGNFNGIDSFSFTASDGPLTSEPATMTINVTPVNDIPTAESQSFKASLNTPTTFQLSATDIDDTLFSYNIRIFPTHGRLDTSLISSGRLQYCPDVDYRGGDTVKFIARDPSGGESRQAIVTIVVGTVNKLPIANPQNVTIDEDEATTLFLTASNVETSNSNFSITGFPSLGKFDGGKLPNIGYRPSPNVNGIDSVFFTVGDGTQVSAPARVLITILPVNDAPVAKSISIPAKLNETVTIKLNASDTDGINFTYQVTKEPNHGKVDISDIKDSIVRYTPDVNYKGYDTIWYRAFDEALLASQVVPVSIGIALENQAPMALPQTVTLKEGESKAVTLKGQDLESASLTYAITKAPAHGSTGTTMPPNIVYTPDAKYSGPDTLKFTVYDGQLTSNAAVVNFIVEKVNHPPLANQGGPVTANFNTPVNLPVSGWDPDGGTWTYRITKMPAHGRADTTYIRYPTVVYYPNTDYYGPDAVTFVVIDPAGLQSDPMVISITVLPNQKPVATGQSVPTNEDVSCTITLSGSDPEQKAITYSNVKLPSRGDLSGTGTSRTYLPHDNVNGADTFTFKVNDGFLDSDPAMVIITIRAVNDPPVAVAGAVPASGTAPLTVAFNGSGSTDPDHDALTYAWTFGDAGTDKTANPSHVYTAAGSYTATLTVSDGKGGSNSATVAITVTSAPTITTDPVSRSVNVGAAAIFTVAAIGSAPLTYQWQEDRVNIAAATGTTYSITAAALLDDGKKFRCIVTNTFGSDTSTEAALTVTSVVAPTITTGPVSRSVNVDAAASFTVAASGTAPLTYQWQRDRVNIAAATGATYSITAVALLDDGKKFRCIVTNSVGSDTSTEATLTVTSVVVPTVTTNPVSQSVNEGVAATFTVAATGTAPLTYQWQRNSVNIATANGATYTITTASGDSGKKFRCIVTNAAGSDTSTEATLTVTSVVEPTITTNPVSLSVNEGAVATFTVAATGTAPLTYQWQRERANIATATAATYSITAASIDDGKKFRCIVTNTAGSDTSTEATLTVTGVVAPTITTEPVSRSVAVGAAATFTVAATGTAPLTYQWQRERANIATATAATYSITAASIDDGKNFRCIVTNAAGSDTSTEATLTVTSVAAPTITTDPVSRSVAVGAEVTFTVAATGTGLIYQWQRGGINIGSSTTATLTIAAAVLADNGATFRCVVSNSGGSVTSAEAVLTVE